MCCNLKVIFLVIKVHFLWKQNTFIFLLDSKNVDKILPKELHT